MKAKDIKEVKKEKRKRVFKPKAFDGEKAYNPFVSPKFIIPVTKETINIGLFKKTKEGDVSAEKDIFREQHKFVKFYTDLTYDEEDEEGERIVLNKVETPSLRKDRARLTPKSAHLLLWIMDKMEYSKDYVFIDRNAYMDESGISLNTYKAALKELIDLAFISPSSSKNMYWINPFFMFKGDRTAKYTQNVLVVYDETQEAKKAKRQNQKEV